MRKTINQLFRTYYAHRMKRIEHYMRRPHPVQQSVFRQLIQTTKHTEWGRQYDFKTLSNAEQFADRIPVQDYESLKPYIERMMYGEKDVLWSGPVKWFSKSSGTTSERSKYIPVSNQNLKQCHIRGTWDTMTFFYDQRPDARQFECKSLLMGGNIEHFAPYPKTMRGDVSAIMMEHMPWVAKPFFTPSFEVALMDDFEGKIEAMARITSQEDLVMAGGVPTWTIVLFRKILEITGKENILEVWPNFQGYIHGGVSFTPYKSQFQQFLPGNNTTYIEVYNASEGYFAIQNETDSDDMLLLLDNGVYYEFLPMDEWDKDFPKAIPLGEVQVGKNYAMVISTNSGLWRYKIGDTVEFTSIVPYKIKITGRTKQFVNAFGEEVMVDNADEAIAMTCQMTGAAVLDYTVAPIYFEGNSKGGHEWLIEFDKVPENIENFRTKLDLNLQKINSDYEAKRHKNMALTKLKLRVLPPDTFHDWLRRKGKFGGQSKIPRLSNDRKYIEEILGFCGEQGVII